MTTVQRLPVSWQANAIAWPKLPLLTAMTSVLGIDVATRYAARNLKLPVCWNVSAANVIRAPSSSLSFVGERSVVGRGSMVARLSGVTMDIGVVIERDLWNAHGSSPTH